MDYDGKNNSPESQLIIVRALLSRVLAIEEAEKGQWPRDR